MVRSSPRSNSTCPTPTGAELGPGGRDLPASLSKVAPCSHSLSHTLWGRYTTRPEVALSPM